MSFQLTESRPLRVLTAVRPGSGETPSISRLEAFSRHTAVESRLYCAVYDPHLSSWQAGATVSDQDLKDFLLNHEQANLESMKQAYGGLCKSCETQVEWQHPAATGIVQAANDYEADAVFLASSRLTQNLDYHDWEILTRTRAPVLVCNTPAFQPYRRILVAVDPTHSHHKAREIDLQLLTEASAIAKLFEAELHVVHAYPGTRSYVTPEALVPHELIEVWRQQHEEAVETLVADFAVEKIEKIEKIHMVPDLPRQAVLKTATEIDADLLVMGVNSRSKIAEMLLGHTAEYVINHSTCDVLGLRGA